MSLECLPADGEELEELILQTPREELHTLEQPLLACWKVHGLGAAAVLRNLSDEVLAIAYQNELLRALVFEELFWGRAKIWFERWFRRWSVRQEEAEDLVQDLFLKFLENCLATYSPERTFQAYLYRSAWNLLAERRRRRSPAPLNEELCPTHASGPTEEAIGNELTDRVEQLLRDMGEDLRQVFRLSTQSGLSAEQIAQRFGWPKSRVFRLLFQARREIEQGLGNA
jgi:RNA polymerase sigma factor (sigma-70 family)